MARKLSLLLLPLLALAGIALLFPDSKPTTAVVSKVARAFETVSSGFQSQEVAVEAPATTYERLVIPTVTVGPEHAQQPEVRILAIRNDRNYGWIQLPRGTVVQLIRSEGDYLIAKYEETILRVHKSVVDAGLVVPKRIRTYAVAY